MVHLAETETSTSMIEEAPTAATIAVTTQIVDEVEEGPLIVEQPTIPKASL